MHSPSMLQPRPICSRAMSPRGPLILSGPLITVSLPTVNPKRRSRFARSSPPVRRGSKLVATL